MLRSSGDWSPYRHDRRWRFLLKPRRAACNTSYDAQKSEAERETPLCQTSAVHAAVHNRLGCPEAEREGRESARSLPSCDAALPREHASGTGWGREVPGSRLPATLH